MDVLPLNSLGVTSENFVTPYKAVLTVDLFGCFRFNKLLVWKFFYKILK